MLTKIFYHILGLLVAFCLLFAVLITVTETLLYRVDGYFAKEYQKYAVTERVDMRLSDLLSVTDEMMDYLKGDRENLNVEAVIGGVQREFFNAKEKRHMQDVRELFLQGLALRRGAVFVGVLAAAFLCLKKRQAVLLRMLQWGIADCRNVSGGQPSVLADGRRTAAKAEIKKAEIKRIAMIKLILFGILKGIGILLLVLLLLLLLMVLVVLLSPIRYHLEGEKRAAVSGSFGVSWLFGAIRADGGYTPEGGSRLKLRVLWFTPVGGEEKPKKKKKKKKRKEPEPIEIHAAEKESKEEPEPAEPKPEPKKEQPKQEPKKQEPKKQAKPQRMAEKQPKTMRRVKLSEIAEKPPAPEEIEDDAFFTGEEQEKAEEPEKKGKIPPILKELWSIEDKKQIFKAFGKLLKRLMKGILPGNFFLKATIGTGDPPTTGYLLGLAGILVAKFGNDIQIKGDFTKATVEDIEIRVKGKIVLGRLLWAVLAFGLTKPVRRAIRKEIRYFRGKKADAKGETA